MRRGDGREYVPLVIAHHPDEGKHHHPPKQNFHRYLIRVLCSTTTGLLLEPWSAHAQAQAGGTNPSVFRANIRQTIPKRHWTPKSTQSVKHKKKSYTCDNDKAPIATTMCWTPERWGQCASYAPSPRRESRWVAAGHQRVPVCGKQGENVKSAAMCERNMFTPVHSTADTRSHMLGDGSC